MTLCKLSVYFSIKPVDKYSSCRDEGEVDVEVGNEVVVTSVSSNDRIIDDKSCVDERVVLSCKLTI